MTTRSPSTPKLITAADALRGQLAQSRRAGKTIGFVPTMGALHVGHTSLIDASRAACDVTVASIFVNPTQFGPQEDFSRYPRTLEADLALLGEHGTDLVFAPTTETMYNPHDATAVEVAGPALVLEGAFRPGHFRGVATVVLKLFNLVQPDRAFFGRKDYQQSLVVRRMTADLCLNTQIDVCPTVRETDGLALSSRNRYLSASERQRALSISASLRLARELVAAGTRDAKTLLARMRALLDQAKLEIDYVALADRDTLEPVEVVNRPIVALIAARVGATRLIDNELIDP